MLTEIRARWRYALAGALIGGPVFFVTIWLACAAAVIVEGM